MKPPIVRMAYRTTLITVALTLSACQSGNDVASQPLPADEQQTAKRLLEDSDFAERAELSKQIDAQYEAIMSWLRENGLKQRSYAELVALAKDDAAAAKYIECDESSRSPAGTDTRLGLLSTCLTDDPGKDLPAETVPRSVAISENP